MLELLAVVELFFYRLIILLGILDDGPLLPSELSRVGTFEVF